MRRAVAIAVIAVSCGVHPRATAPHTPLHVVVIGDSVAHGAGDESGRGIAGVLGTMLHVPVGNFGINGARTTDVLRAMTKMPIETADAVIVSIGGNDLYGDRLARIASTLWPGHAMRRTAA